MPDILIVILAVIFVLGIAINIHEFGHFIVAKLFGMRVEAYSFFGLGPRIWGFKVGHTDYRISAIPLGAYVKLYGDEVTAPLEGGASGGEKVPESELYELRPRWQKFLVMLGGPFMNIVLALAIPFVGALIVGVPSMPAPVVGVVNNASAAAAAGIKPGDRIVSFNGMENPTWEAIRDEALISPEIELPVVVDRGGERVHLTVTPEKKLDNGNAVGEIGLVPDAGVEPVEIGTITADSPAAASGLQTGDRVIAFNGQTVRNSQELSNQIRENKDAPLRLTIERNGVRSEIQTAARQSDDGVFRIGIGFAVGAITTRVPVGITGAASFALESNLRILRLTGKVFGQMFSGERSVKDAGLAGPVGIVQIISQVVTEMGFAGLFGILAVISLNLGVFNLLPIPLLDGGQIMVLGIEKVMSWFGKTLSIAIREKIQLAGLAVILLLMVFTLFLDISRFF
ncbi:MAG: RIP metalloprotease RseP [Pyrinomonadaceae bacterium]